MPTFFGKIKIGIGLKIGLLTILLTLIAAGILGGQFYSKTKGFLVDQALENMGDTIHIESAYLKAVIETLRQDVAFLAHTPPIQGIVRSRQAGGTDPLDGSTDLLWRQRLTAIFQNFLGAKPHYFQLRYIGLKKNGREIVRVQREGNSITSVSEVALESIGNRLYFKKTIRLAQGKIYLSKVNLVRDRGKVVVPHLPVMRAGIPVYDQSRNLFGIVIIDMDFGWILKKIAREGALQYIVNSDGDFIFHPDPEKTFGFDLDQRYRIQNSFPQLAGFLMGKNKKKNTSLISESDGEKKAVFFHKMNFDPLQPDRFLGLGRAVSYETILASLMDFSRYLFFLVSLVVAGIAVLAYLFSRVLVEPLRQMTVAAGEFSRGNFDVTLPLNMKDEIGVLANSFKEMIREIKASQDQLESRVRERTAEVTTIIESVLDPLITIDEMGVIQNFNPAAERVFGYLAHEAVGRNVKMLMPEPYQNEHDSYLSNYRETGEAKVIGLGREVLGRRKNGSVFPLDLAVNEMKVGDKTLYVGMCRDITERKKAEQELNSSRADLERQNWFKTGLANLHETMRGEEDEAALCQNIINHLADQLKIQIGAIYLSQNGEMRFAAGYAYSKKMKLAKKYQKEGGLVGQAALEKRSILVRNVEDDCIRIQSSFIDSAPKNVLVAPILYEDEVLGVLELASLNEIKGDQREFLDQALKAIAVSLHSARSRARLTKLLQSKV